MDKGTMQEREGRSHRKDKMDRIGRIEEICPSLIALCILFDFYEASASKQS
jgi:hypothetical protein